MQIESRYRLANNSRRLIEIASAVATKLSEAEDAILVASSRNAKAAARIGKIGSRDGDCGEYA